MRQPDDPGPPEPFDPDPMKRVRESPWIRAYLAIVALVIVASFVFWE